MKGKPALNKIAGHVKKLPLPVKIGGVVLAGLLLRKLFARVPRVGADGRTSITKTEAGIIAEAQWSGMEGLDFGDQSELLAMLEPLNSSDLRVVFDKFGRRPYGFAGSLPIWLGGADKDIFGWYSSELSGDTLKDMRALWAKSNLPITF